LEEKNYAAINSKQGRLIAIEKNPLELEKNDFFS